jgi:hypothetical protein
MEWKQSIEANDIVKQGRSKILYAINSPLGFFVLSLLIVESFLAIVLIEVEFDNNQKMMGLWVGVGMFIFLVFAVIILVWYKAPNLTYDKDAHLIERKRTMLISSSSPKKIYLKIDPGNATAIDINNACVSLQSLQQLIGGPGIDLGEEISKTIEEV